MQEKSPMTPNNIITMTADLNLLILKESTRAETGTWNIETDEVKPASKSRRKNRLPMIVP
jgi:hypothetical protein